MAAVDNTTSSAEAAVGHKDGEVLDTGEIVVYDFDKDGQYSGWHKAPAQN